MHSRSLEKCKRQMIQNHSRSSNRTRIKNILPERRRETQEQTEMILDASTNQIQDKLDMQGVR